MSEYKLMMVKCCASVADGVSALGQCIIRTGYPAMATSVGLMLDHHHKPKTNAGTLSGTGAGHWSNVCDAGPI